MASPPLFTREALLKFEGFLEDDIHTTLLGRDFASWDPVTSDSLDEVIEKFRAMLCATFGHQAVVDFHCMRPACDHCAFCGTSMPGQAPR